MHYVKAQLRKGSRHLQGVDVVRVAYHKYGLKYLALFLALTTYSFVGAGIFLFFEKPAEIERLSKRQRTFEDLRQTLVTRLLDDLFNDTEKPIIFVDAGQIEAISRTFSDGLHSFEEVLNDYHSKHSMEPLLRWDLWTALIYAWTVITTIGYGHLVPLTVGGRIATMLYAVVGIPLMLTVLSNVGKLLTKGLKYPFILVKRCCRRIFSYCTKMSREQILEADEKDRSRLEVFDLPIPVAIALVVGWIFICSAITLIWEKDWDYLVAFYFFFISLSTIGFGDVVPGQPYYLLVMFGNTMIGMALLSMLLNLIQGKLEPIAIEEDADPFEMDRNGLRKALRRASMFTNIPLMPQRKTGQMLDAPYLLSPTNGGDITLKVPAAPNNPATTDWKMPKPSKQPKIKTEGMTGGVAVSALSAFLAPLFSATAPTNNQSPADTPTKKRVSPVPSVEKAEAESRKSEAQDQLIIIDEDEKAAASSLPNPQAEKDEAESIAKLRPLRKTVSFQANELSALIDRACNPDPDQMISPAESAGQVALASKAHTAVKAMALIDSSEGAGMSSIRLRRVDGVATLDRPRRQKKSRFLSMREDSRSDGLKAFGSPRRKHGTTRPPQPMDPGPISTHPKGSKISSATLPLPGPDGSRGARERRRLKRTDTRLDVTDIGHSAPLLEPQDTHSTCSICTYDPLLKTHPVVTPVKKKRSQRNDLLHHHGRHPSDTLVSEKDLDSSNNSRSKHQERRGHRKKAIQSFDTLPDDEASLFACLDAAIDADAPTKPSYRPNNWSDHLLHRHSISTDAAPEFFRSFPVLAPATSDQQHYLSAKTVMIMQNSETQTMISFPSQDSDSRITITGQRGTARSLPDSVPFTEINRLVDLNIKAELLRNELESLAMVESAPGDISDYEHVLSLQEVVDQMSHEASLPRGGQANQ